MFDCVLGLGPPDPPMAQEIASPVSAEPSTPTRGDPKRTLEEAGSADSGSATSQATNVSPAGVGAASSGKTPPLVDIGHWFFGGAFGHW